MQLRMHVNHRLTVLATITCTLALVLGTTACSSGAATKTTQRAVAGTHTPSCTTAGLVVWLSTEGSGSAGGSYYNLEFTNVSGHQCTLSGYPGVSAINLGGHQLGSAAAHNAAVKALVITLDSVTSSTGLPSLGGNTTATVVVKIVDVGVYSPGTCEYTTVAGLRVYPPNQTTSKVIPFPFVACSHAGPQVLQVQALTKGVTTN